VHFLWGKEKERPEAPQPGGGKVKGGGGRGPFLGGEKTREGHCFAIKKRKEKKAPFKLMGKKKEKKEKERL